MWLNASPPKRHPDNSDAPHHLRSLVSCFESTTYLRGSISSAPRQNVPHSKPSSTSARFGPTATPAEQSAENWHDTSWKESSCRCGFCSATCTVGLSVRRNSHGRTD